ncbi:MAG TPA: hypothetical protein VIK39_12295 [Candidatus Angelobacter sp.]
MEINKFTLGYHLVAFLDVLGQRDKFRSLRLPTNADEEALVAKVLADTAGHVLRLRRLFNSQFETFESGLTYPELAKQPVHPKFVGFSDSFVMSVPLRNNNGDLIPIATIYSTMTAASIVMLSSLVWKHALRGGIDVGLATQIGPDEIYGTALERAYVLESEGAEYPRILIGDSLWGYLNAALTEFKKSQAGMSKALAAITEKLIGFIGVDTDGKRILDYLGAVKDLMTEATKEHMVLPAYEFVLAEQKRHIESGNEKLIHRYADFRHYFESHLSRSSILSSG